MTPKLSAFFEGKSLDQCILIAGLELFTVKTGVAIVKLLASTVGVISIAPEMV